MDQSTININFTLNHRDVSLDIPVKMTALAVIRDIAGLTGTKEGCGVGECGACTIEVDGQAVNACLMLGAQLDGTTVLTVEGLSKASEDSDADITRQPLHHIQEAFIENHGVQCGFCTPGILMSTHALLNETPAPDDDQIKKAISGNICRCTGYQQIFTSVKAACRAADGNGGTH